jgi:hypothetical protein
MALPKNTLILQFPTRLNPDFSLDQLHEFEAALGQGLLQSRSGNVDGHDWGTSGPNVFILPSVGKAWPSIDVVKAHLKRRSLLDKCLVVKRYKSERYEVVWPENYDGDFERT